MKRTPVRFFTSEANFYVSMDAWPDSGTRIDVAAYSETLRNTRTKQNDKAGIAKSL